MEQLYNWEQFWQEWHNEKAQNEADLYYQVAKTVNKQPMRSDIFNAINNSIIDILSATANDNLVELCCGNGLCTYEFRNRVRKIVAVDFSHHLIEAARAFKSAPNIVYCQQNVFSFLETFTEQWDFVPAKFLMNDSLAYFVPAQLEDILRSMINISGGQFVFLVRGVPNDELKWNYYNTAERRQKYMELVQKGDVTNDGMGRWWLPAEIATVCRALQLEYTIQNQLPPVSDYRMDVLIECGKYNVK